MADTNTVLGGKIEFIQNHQPGLTMGNYTVSVAQAIEAKNQPRAAGNFPETFPTATLNFSVLGPRFTLNPQEIQAIFPPSGSLGDHSNVLPHIILNRSTLPWERSPDRTSKTTSWLALLLFTDDEVKTKVTIQPLKVSDLNAKFPQWQPELGDQGDDPVTVIEVDKTLLQAIMPTKADLECLAHVRQTQDPTGKLTGDGVAVIIGNRLPQPGQMSTVHLVSLEGCYPPEGNEFIYSTGNTVPLVSLTSWRFACVDRRQSFKALLMHLNHQLLFNIQDDGISAALNQGQALEALKQALTQSNHSLAGAITVDRVQWKITDKTRTYLISNTFNVYNQAGKNLFKLDTAPVTPIDAKLKGKFQQQNHSLSEASTIVSIDTSKADHWWINTEQYSIVQDDHRLYVYYLDPDRSSTLRLPPLKSTDQTATAAESHFKMGSVPLSHAMRQGNKTVSWYHGPLVPGSNTTTADFSLPVRSADDLVRYNSTYGMFDVSYAAAWELGRLLALQSKSFSVSLYNWKRTHAQMIKDAEQQLDHLPLDGPSASLDIPPAVSSWFEHLALLEGLPFNYLVPDERLLPPESIRCFQIDPMWMECLMDGAFSIGRVLASDHAQDASLQEKTTLNTSMPEHVSGFLLRSDVVAGWPGLQVDGYDQTAPEQKEAGFPFNLALTFKVGLSHAEILTGLQNDFKTKTLVFSAEKVTVENQQWSIFEHQGTLKYRLNRQENDEIDVCSPDGKTFLFSIDIGFETNLNSGTITADLQQIFQASKQEFPANSVIAVTGWFISDNANQKHYWIQADGKLLKVDRQYKLPLLRMQALSKNVLICLFDGIVKAIDLHLKPETLHFGVNTNPENNGFLKKLKDYEGKDNGLSIPVPQKNTTDRVIKIQEMASNMNNTLKGKDPTWKGLDFTPAEFALEMIEGVEKVRFIQG
jgi:hypothetical protein